MSTLSDIIALLDRWPKWKELAALPERVQALEARLQALEGKTGARPLGPTDCPKCRTPLEFVSEKPHEHFGDIGGLKVHTLRCATCGMQVEREFDPGRGYKTA